MRSIRQFESRAGIVIEKIRTYATVDGKIYWCSLNFWVQPQNLQNYGSDVTTNNTRGCLIIILTNLHVRQNPSIKQINWQLPITVLSCQKPRVFLPKCIVNFAAGFSNQKELKKRKDRFPMAFFIMHEFIFEEWIAFLGTSDDFQRNQKWGTRKTKKVKVYMSKSIFHFSVNPFRGFFAGRMKKGLTKKTCEICLNKYYEKCFYKH